MKYRKQKGLTLIGFILVLALTIFFAYIAMRIGPLYLEYQALANAMEVLEDDPASKSMDPNKLRYRLLDILWVSYATDNIKAQNIKIKRNNGLELRVAYEVRRPIMGNVDVVVSFDRSVVLR